jgi:hypothetical protein
MTFNMDGRWYDGAMRERILATIYRNDLDGISLIDARFPVAEAANVRDYWTEALADSAVVVKVCPAQPPLSQPAGTTDRTQLVGGAVLIFRERENLSVRSVEFDPGQHGILTVAHIGVGKSHTVNWLSAYVPSKHAADAGDGALGKKVEGWIVAVVDKTKATNAEARRGSGPGG